MSSAPILTTCVYYSEHFKCVKEVADSIDSSDAVFIRVLQQLISDPEIEGKLCYIRPNFGFIPTAITSFGKSGVKLIELLAAFTRTLLPACFVKRQSGVRAVVPV